MVLLAVDTDDASDHPKIPEFLKKRGIHARVLLGGPEEPRGYETHPGAIYLIDRRGVLAGVPGDDYTDDPAKGVEARLPDLLAGKPVPAANPRGWVYLVFDSSSRGRAVTGSDGCNSITGSYDVKGDTLAFASLRSTAVGCPKTMDVQRAFGEALKAATRWRVIADRLDRKSTRLNSSH